MCGFVCLGPEQWPLRYPSGPLLYRASPPAHRPLWWARTRRPCCRYHLVAVAWGESPEVRARKDAESGPS